MADNFKAPDGPPPGKDGAPPSYPQQPPQVHHDAGPYYPPNASASPAPNPMNQVGAYPPAQDPYGQYPNQPTEFYGQPQGPYDQSRGWGGQPGYGPPMGGPGYGGPPPGGMYYGQPQQGYPPPGGYYPEERSRGGGAATGICAGIMGALACCCCLDILF